MPNQAKPGNAADRLRRHLITTLGTEKSLELHLSNGENL
jgi:hypothetical protein